MLFHKILIASFSLFLFYSQCIAEGNHSVLKKNIEKEMIDTNYIFNVRWNDIDSIIFSNISDTCIQIDFKFNDQLASRFPAFAKKCRESGRDPNVLLNGNDFINAKPLIQYDITFRKITIKVKNLSEAKAYIEKLERY